MYVDHRFDTLLVLVVHIFSDDNNVLIDLRHEFAFFIKVAIRRARCPKDASQIEVDAYLDEAWRDIDRHHDGGSLILFVARISRPKQRKTGL